MMLWVLAAAGMIPALAAVRAYLIERREGLACSKARVLGAPAAALALVALAWGMRQGDDAPVSGGAVSVVEPRPSAPASPPPRVPPDPAVAALRDQLAALRSSRDQLNARIASVEAQLEHLAPAKSSEAGGGPPGDEAGPPDDKPGPPGGKARPGEQPPRPLGGKARPGEEPQRPGAGAPPVWPAYVAIALLLAACALLLVGDLSTLLPGRRAVRAPQDDGVEPPGVWQLADHARAGRWKDGLATAAALQIEQLPKLEVLDLLFLRALCNTMLACDPGASAAPMSRDARRAALAAAGDDLARLLELAPHMAEALWLQGYVDARQGRWQPALDRFRRARPDLEDLAFDRCESVCLLELGEQRMAAADNDGADRLFDEVTRLGVLADHIPVVMVRHRILSAREAIRAGNLAEAAHAIERIRQVDRLAADARHQADAVCDVHELVIRHRSGQLGEALDATVALLARWQPEKLPAIEDQIADEFLHPAIDRAALRVPAELYRALYFREAVLRIELAGRRGRPLAAEAIDAIAAALLRALQFEPRHRDALAALAALYLAYRKDRTERALGWLDAAIALGVRSRRARTLLLEARRAETDRKELLDMFRSASARFLSDPALGAQVRGALIEELGRFNEFRPVILELQDGGTLDLAPGELTISALHDRAAFVAGVAARATRHGHGDAAQALHELHRELDDLTVNVDASATRIGAIERAIMEQVGQLVLR
jgi:hypothetical protein